MNYEKHYNNLINRAKDRKLDGYKEIHHITPKCLGGGDDKTNLVELTAEEHFIAHQLLVKIYPSNRSLVLALSKMCSSSSTHRGNRNNKWYGWIRKRYSAIVSGEKNPSAKFTNEEVLEIYHSTETLDFLAKKYGVKRYNIITIKRKIFYRNVTETISVLPGFSDEDLQGRGSKFPIPIDIIENIFYDTGDYKHFWEKYRATEKVVRSIKNKKTFKKITRNLGNPGQVRRYGLTRDMVEAIYNANGTNTEIADQFKIHYNTVRNIKGKGSRAFDIWEEF